MIRASSCPRIALGMWLAQRWRGVHNGFILIFILLHIMSFFLITHVRYIFNLDIIYTFGPLRSA